MPTHDNPLRTIADGMQVNMADAVERICQGAAENMKDRLVANGHYRTGRTADSIEATSERRGRTVIGRVMASKVVDFIDKGTGAAHGRPGGREGYWRYRDDQGQWHTTDGMDPDPFIDDALDDVMMTMADDVIDGILRRV